MTAPWRDVVPLTAEAFAKIRQRAIFDLCKWDPQVGDVCTIADVPIVLRQADWDHLVAMAEALARELLAAEDELAERPDLCADLGLPRAIVNTLEQTSRRRSPGFARLVRFDFHHTPDGWRISEANSDVPGGLNEASGLAGLMRPHHPGTVGVGDVAGAYVNSIVAAVGQGAAVGLVHATAYTDDRQVMVYLSQRLTQAGLRTSLLSPADLRWHEGWAERVSSGGRLDGLIRFFPAEWLPNLPRRCGWTHFFRGASTPTSNPATSLLTQSKRLPLLWPWMHTPMPTWRSLLPETLDPREVRWRSADDWILKPVLGRVGEGVGIVGVTEAKEMQRITREATRHPARWIAQRRFESTPLQVGENSLHASVGVYTVDGRAVGAYGRLARRPLIDDRACDAAVLVEVEEADLEESASSRGERCIA